ncbi:MAG TPA: DNA-processing protein DprA, partial [Patescibacteria group bacterium]|nr:DNA-processing protein DprA [Patescibacteria group bacterium]
ESIYPRGHLNLAHQILDNGGLIISEQPPGTPGLPQNFVARNRIIAGLSLGVIIVECKTKSGALLTADYAADFNRNLYAVPGPAYSSLSAGPHQLIKNGATLITTGDEVLEDLHVVLAQLPSKPQMPFSELELRVLKCMQDKAQSINEISEAVNLPISEVAKATTLLELSGAIEDAGNNTYIQT